MAKTRTNVSFRKIDEEWTPSIDQSEQIVNFEDLRPKGVKITCVKPDLRDLRYYHDVLFGNTVLPTMKPKFIKRPLNEKAKNKTTSN